MINVLDNGFLNTDLEADGFNILNCNMLEAGNLLSSDDLKLNDSRTPPNGSVTDASVADDAAIVQSKLSLNGPISTWWLGSSDTTAARGDLVERLSRKNTPNGYAGLGLDGKLPSGSVPLSGTGTVTELKLQFPHEFAVITAVSTGIWTFGASWAAVNPNSWFGNPGNVAAPPTFNDSELPSSLIPNIDASVFTSGTFDPAVLPVAVGVGASHAPGITPYDDGTGLGSDYLARDMTFKPTATPIAYQPSIPAPSITILSYIGPVAMVTLTGIPDGANLFYSVGDPVFTEITDLPIQVSIGSTIMVYSAKTGYNNSGVVKYTIPDPGEVTT